MSSHYRGRRAHRERGVNPIMFMVAGVVVILAGLLLWLNLRKQDRPVREQTPVEDATPTDLPEEENEPEDPVIEPIAINGEVRESGGLLLVGDTAYELYSYVDETAKKYATCVNKAADALAGTAKVYDMVIPLSSGITLPDELYGRSDLSDQKEAESTILGYMNGNVITVPLYDTLMEHRTEYVYYRTDHHWTGLGAYYAYTQFCQAAGLTAHALNDYQTMDFGGYLGSFYNDTKDELLAANPDVVTGYYPVSPNTPMSVTDKNGNVIDLASVVYDESTAPASFKYGAYIYGDNPYTVIENASVTDGSSCVVVKESFGNAYVPFLVDHFQTVYVIDYRYWSGSLTDFVRTNGVKTVIFCNNLSAIRNNALIGDLYSVL